jgi:hypothetical protein
MCWKSAMARTSRMPRWTVFVNGTRAPVCAFDTGNLTECTRQQNRWLAVYLRSGGQAGRHVQLQQHLDQRATQHDVDPALHQVTAVIEQGKAKLTTL